MQHPGLQHQGGKAAQKQTTLSENKSTYAIQRFVGILFTMFRLITKWKTKPKLCHLWNGLFTHSLKPIKSVRIINLLRQLRIPVGHLDALSSRSWLSYFCGKSTLHACPQARLWSPGLTDEWGPDLQDFPTTGLRRFVVTCAGIQPSQKKQHNYSGRPVKHPVPSLPKFYLQLDYEMTYKLLLFKQWADNKMVWTFARLNCGTKIKIGTLALAPLHYFIESVWMFGCMIRRGPQGLPTILHCTQPPEPTTATEQTFPCQWQGLRTF